MKAGSRSQGVDLARALAIFLMVATNFKVVMTEGGDAGPAFLAWPLKLLEGKGAALFVVLAGAGLSFLTRRRREEDGGESPRRVRDTVLRRGIFLLVAGFSFFLLWPADILHYYGVYYILAAFFLTGSSRRLWTAFAAFVAGFLLLFLLFDFQTGWNWQTLEYRDAWTLPGAFRNLFFNGWHPVVPWTAFLLAGMWLGRQDLSSPSTCRVLLVVSASVALGLEAVSHGLVWALSRGASPADAEFVRFALGTSLLPPLPLYMLVGTASSFAIIVLCVRFSEARGQARWLPPLAATGRQSLTLYVAHVVLGMGLLEGRGLLYKQSLPFSLACAGMFCAVSVLFAFLWSKRFAHGPLEWVMRKMT